MSQPIPNLSLDTRSEWTLGGHVVLHILEDIFHVILEWTSSIDLRGRPYGGGVFLILVLLVLSDLLQVFSDFFLFLSDLLLEFVVQAVIDDIGEDILGNIVVLFADLFFALVVANAHTVGISEVSRSADAFCFARLHAFPKLLVSETGHSKEVAPHIMAFADAVNVFLVLAALDLGVSALANRSNGTILAALFKLSVVLNSSIAFSATSLSNADLNYVILLLYIDILNWAFSDALSALVISEKSFSASTSSNSELDISLLDLSALVGRVSSAVGFASWHKVNPYFVFTAKVDDFFFFLLLFNFGIWVGLIIGFLFFATCVDVQQATGVETSCVRLGLKELDDHDLSFAHVSAGYGHVQVAAFIGRCVKWLAVTAAVLSTWVEYAVRFRYATLSFFI